MKRESIVSDLVIDVVKSSSVAVAQHLLDFLAALPGGADIGAVANGMDHGYDVDLDDFVADDQPIGFDHSRISEVFRQRLKVHADVGKNHQATRGDPIWGADEDRGIFALFGHSSPNVEISRSRKTRVSAIVQRAMRDTRKFRQAEKATTSIAHSTLVTIPSPLNIAAQILSDPHNISSQVYAKAALQEWIRGEINSEGKQIDVSFEAVSQALEIINNRWNTSKPIASNRSNPGTTTVFLCNLFAIHGFMGMRIDLSVLRWLPANDQSLYLDTKDADDLFETALLGGRGIKAEFIVNPHYTELPSIAQVMNLIDGLPIGLEGAEIIFQGGIRLSPEKSIVAAVSGTFGAGKTLLSLSLSAAFAPLGCRTMFLSFEESAEDIEARMSEVAPPGIERAARFYREIPKLSDTSSSNIDSRRRKRTDLAQSDWFMARHIRLEHINGPSDNSVIDPASALSAMLQDTVEHADFFRPWNDKGVEKLPRFARPVIVVDGLHQLFDLPHGDKIIESSLRDLVDECRRLGAIFIFSFSKEALGLKQLEYLCDLIIELDREGFENPGESPRRYFQLLKARRQPARIGAHVFHLQGQNGFRLKPSSDARLQEAKRELWWDPDARAEIFMTDNPPPGFLNNHNEDLASAMAIRNWGQVLIIGKGSSGKAGFGLYLLHRRWFDRNMSAFDQNNDQLSLPNEEFKMHQEHLSLTSREKAIADAELPVWYIPPSLETRVLVVSFLYQSSYYEALTAQLKKKRKGKPDRSRKAWGPIDQLGSFEYSPLPDRMHTDTIELYPGMLGAEDFIAKVEKKLSEAESMGLPYTGVLVDGLHNVFVQFPKLEEPSSFWGMFYNILRRRRVTVVTTHTEFDLQGSLDSELDSGTGAQSSLIYDFEQAQRKIAPLLSALVSGADYLFELSPKQEGRKIVYRVIPRGSIGGDVGNFAFSWDKNRLRLEGTSGPDQATNSIVQSKRETSTADMSQFIKALATQIAKVQL